LERLAGETDCKIFALKGNHDSESVLRSTEKVLEGKFVYSGNKTVKIGDLNVFLMNSHYVQGIYEIPLTKVPENGDILIMHESVPVRGVPAPSEENFRAICKRFKLVFNGHMHFFQLNTLSISNLYMIPAFIPSREIKGNWMLKYEYPEGVEPEVRETPFGFVVIDDYSAEFKPYTPLQKIVRVEIKGEKAEDFLNGIKEIYEILQQREDRECLRVWVETNADPVTIERIFWPTIREYKEILTMDVLRAKPEPRITTPTVIEFEAKAFTREELIERVLKSVSSKQREIVRRIFDEIFTVDYLRTKKPDEPAGFKKLLEIISSNYKVSDAFLTRAWEIVKGRD